ncbi:MAG: hypothetical protein J5825_09790 [Lachnospiraceae bacterium]|nr:hypothetical protein [Lachnospiraceae bacterium]
MSQYDTEQNDQLQEAGQKKKSGATIVVIVIVVIILILLLLCCIFCGIPFIAQLWNVMMGV